MGVSGRASTSGARIPAAFSRTDGQPSVRRVLVRAWASSVGAVGSPPREPLPRHELVSVVGERAPLQWMARGAIARPRRPGPAGLKVAGGCEVSATATAGPVPWTLPANGHPRPPPISGAPRRSPRRVGRGVHRLEPPAPGLEGWRRRRIDGGRGGSFGRSGNGRATPGPPRYGLGLVATRPHGEVRPSGGFLVRRSPSVAPPGVDGCLTTWRSPPSKRSEVSCAPRASSCSRARALGPRDTASERVAASRVRLEVLRTEGRPLRSERVG